MSFETPKEPNIEKPPAVERFLEALPDSVYSELSEPATSAVDSLETLDAALAEAGAGGLETLFVIDTPDVTEICKVITRYLNGDTETETTVRALYPLLGGKSV